MSDVVVKRRGRPPKNGNNNDATKKKQKMETATSEDSSSVSKSGRKKHPIIDVNTLPATQKILFQKMREFYAKNDILENVVIPIIKHKQPVALRLIEWLVINYSNAFPVFYQHPLRPNDKPFNVHEEYVKHEKHWTKTLFDPNARGPRICFPTKTGEVIETTLCQLNFMMWAIENGVVDYTVKHKDEIKAHLKITKKQRQEFIQSEPNRQKKRMRLTQADKSHCLVYVQPMSINIGTSSSFDAGPSFDTSTNNP